MTMVAQRAGFCRNFLRLYGYEFCSYVCLCLVHSGTEVMSGYELLCGCWELNIGYLQKTSTFNC